MTSYNILSRYVYHRTDSSADCLFSIILISVIVNLITFPFYNRANQIKLKQNEKEKTMLSFISHIRSSFKGDEQYFILSAYYKEQNYSPISQLSSSLSLLIQIPFFTAAYYFFTHLNFLSGMQPMHLFFLHNYSLPDSIISFYKLKINLFPIVMSSINLIATVIYTKNDTLSEKVYAISLTLIFLLLLYNAPSALALYWTFNNLITLIKIIALKFKKHKAKTIQYIYSNNEFTTLVLLSILNILFYGLFLPSKLISSSPIEFISYGSSPMNIIFFTFTVLSGFFIYIFFFILFLDNVKPKRIINIYISLSFLFVISCLFFNKNSFLNGYLLYEDGAPTFSIYSKIVNLIIVCAIFFGFVFIAKMCKTFTILPAVFIITLLCISLHNIYLINDICNKNIYEKNKNVQYVLYDNKPIKLSTRGKNLIYILMDRSIGAYFPYVLDLKPEFYSIYSGFVFYPNCLSFGNCTVSGVSAAFGGYNYTAYNMSMNKNKFLPEKHNNALSIIPYNLTNNNFKVLVSDLPLENFGNSEMPKLFFDNRNITRQDLIGNITFETSKEQKDIQLYIQKRNFLMYNFMSAIPYFFKGIIYNNGKYLLTEYSSYSEKEINNYVVLHNLNVLSDIKDDNSNYASIMYNSLTHDHYDNIIPMNTLEPTISNNNNYNYYSLSDFDGNKFNGYIAQISVEACTYFQISKFISFLKENNVYDNTRIVITSDHGLNYNTALDDRFRINDKYTITSYNPILLFKDYNARGDLDIVHDLMTNADAPFLALKDITHCDDIFNQTNIPTSYKNNQDLIITTTGKWNEKSYINDYSFDDFGPIFNGTSIFDINSWRDINDF